ncbi:MAG: asparagine synthase (glutamine-hydrolyzing) [Ignavibacteria bacterium]|nr:MAG: asparagine synthase (glutamine-hydrolyzing) [Ignavibacteria bacterium]
MCGIAGMIGSVDEQALRVMTQMLVHRGPDDGAVWTGPEAGLGHRRLKIIDLSDNARQPMLSSDGRWVLAFNGEIFNYRELRSELIAAGYQFRSESDSEVLLHACVEWGDKVTDRLVGQFAFAFYDTVERRLLLVRDHLGIKPLYYTEHNETLYFASEAKALAAVLPQTRQPDFRLLPRYLAFLWIPGNETLFSGISKLEPGTRAVWRDGRLMTTRYWDPVARWKQIAQTSLGREEREEELRSLLGNAVREQLVSDVPLGLLLSGGVDSTIMLAEMSAHGNVPQAFTATYTRESRARDVFQDDLPYARMAAEAFGVSLDEGVLEAAVSDLLPEAVWHCDEPLADPTIVTNLALTRLARKNMTVLLSGMGADEIFAGYPRYPAVLLGESMRWLPAPLMRAASVGVSAAMRSGLLSAERGRRPAQLLAHLHRPFRDRFLGYSSYWREQEIHALLTSDLQRHADEESLYGFHNELFAQADGLSPLSRMLAVDLCTFLPELNLENMDKTSMANAVEMRVPYLDHRLVEYSMMLPDEDKIRGRDERKVLLRSAWKGRIPDQILQRPKTGYSPPVRGWMRDSLREYTREILLGETARARGLFSSARIEHMIDANAEGRSEHGMQLWTLLVFEHWMQQFADHRDWTPTADPDALPNVASKDNA